LRAIFCNVLKIAFVFASSVGVILPKDKEKSITIACQRDFGNFKGLEQSDQQKALFVWNPP